VEAEHGPVEICVANAGITRDTLLLRMTDEDIEAVLDTNLVGRSGSPGALPRACCAAARQACLRVQRRGHASAPPAR
jgi:NAD(P)-dependent dehydrogenase (short-subunit alcohol dehydrogenase family)